MTALTHANLPTQAQINKQFTHGNINGSVARYTEIKNPNNSGYVLGNLTQKWYGPNAQWISDIDSNYDLKAREKIVGYIVDFLTTKPDPTPFTIVWSNGSPSITKTANTIEIVGYHAPPE
jgi:hypothetical protein